MQERPYATAFSTEGRLTDFFRFNGPMGYTEPKEITITEATTTWFATSQNFLIDK